MKTIKKIIFPIIIIAITAVVVNISSGNERSSQSYLATNIERQGSSLLFDTLEHMGYPVSISHRPINILSSTDYVHVVVHPPYPAFDYEYIRANIIPWVTIGGRIVFLHSLLLQDIDLPYTSLERFKIYEIGDGIIITGFSRDVTNYNLMNTPDTGILLEAILRNLDAERLIFVEYYHMPSRNTPLFFRLPIVIRLLIVQFLLICILIVWLTGKRFGNPTPYFEEHERDENEHVHALTRLYMITKRRSK